jgi:hypothetical protein
MNEPPLDPILTLGESLLRAATSQGRSHHTAVRSLAFKWIRILFRCWQDRKPYNELLYEQALARHSQEPDDSRSLIQFEWKSRTGFSKTSSIRS